ncbi:hypothetical protein MMC11_007313 [Xylographa trunciseda]|nr:hypothetical protein [Xylographa trunciseda]
MAVQFLMKVIVALHAVSLFTTSQAHTPGSDHGQSKRMTGEKRQLMTSYSNDTLNAHIFEESYRAHGSVSTDPFYTVPEGTANAEAGTLFKVERETNTSLYTLAPNLSLSRFMYQSKASNGSLVPVSAYVLWPYLAQPYSKGYPVVAWAHGTSGSTAECAPSNIRNLWHHFQAPYQLAQSGYVVVATDYAGLGVETDASGNHIAHEYITGPAQANDVAYSIQAARKAFPGLAKEFVVMGSSEGGGAAWSFAQRQVLEPLDGHLGTIPLSPVTRLLSLPPSEAIFTDLIYLLAPGLQANYPDFTPSDILTPVGVQSVDTYLSLRGCNTVLYQQPEGTDILKPGWQNNSAIQKYEEVSTNGGQEISGPMLVIQGGADPVVYPPSVTNAVNETVAKFPLSKIEYYLLPNVTHAPAMHAGQKIWLEWIAARFAGTPAKPGYHFYEPDPVRPAAAQQPETNWFIQIETEPWQAT